MLFDTLEIPDQLLIAQEEGRFVVFAGAGVSMGEPSTLPGFLRLTEQVAGRRLTRGKGSGSTTCLANWWLKA